MCFTETWLNNTFLNSEMFGYTFNVFQKDMIAITPGGGVLIATSQQDELIELHIPNSTEFIAVVMKIN